MDKILIEGGTPLSGAIAVSGSKNAVLPLMVAGLLSDEKLILRGTPRLADTRTLAGVLQQLGAEVDEFGNGPGEGLTVETKQLTSTRAPYELVSKMRASFWVLGPLLARAGQAQVSLPGGCAIGTRPVDLYLKGLAAMGAELAVEAGYVNAVAPEGLQGARIDLPFVSVGATHVLMMAATLAAGETVITNAASEPEVVDVGRCLQAMGAQIDGLGTRTLIITGVDRLHGADHTVSRDRIEAGAFALAVAATGGRSMLTGIDEAQLGALAPAMRLAGCGLQDAADGLIVSGPAGRPKATPVTTEPYPGFATDLQAPFMGLMCCADGVSRIRETIFENRFMHVQELARLGADISLQGDTALVTGVPQLHGAPVMATDLRASVTLVIAGLMAQGVTEISRVYHLDRGYERIEEKLSGAGGEDLAGNGMSVVPPAPLKLFARDAADIDVLSAHLQDAVAQTGDMAYQRDERRFVVLVNRFCWEYDKTPMRVRSALQIANVRGAQMQKLTRARADAVVSVLALRFEVGDAPAGRMRLVLSGGGEIRLDVEACEAILEDVTAPWVSRSRPDHGTEA